jgi:hypothetical protein
LHFIHLTITKIFGKQDIRNLRYARKSKTARSAVAAILDN